MSSLSTVEGKIFEDLLDMSGGYVLKFTNDQFATFFRREIGIDIYSVKYEFRGKSKANRLRAFWEIESDILVGNTLLKLLEIWEYETSEDEKNRDVNKYNHAKNIIARLTGMEPEPVLAEDEFLNRQYQNISVKNLPVDPNLKPILEARLNEAKYCLRSAPLATIFLCGSIMEGILLGVAMERPKEFNQARSAPKYDDGKVKKFENWTLSQFINVAHELGLLRLDVRKYSHSLREFRNYIHPYEQMVSKFSPDKHTAEISIQVLNAAIAHLSGERS